MITAGETGFWFPLLFLGGKIMRLDKYLKSIQTDQTRTVANEAAMQEEFCQ